MKISLIIALVVAACCILYPPASTAQTTRQIRVSVDTVRLNVCDDKNFVIDVNLVDPILRSDSVFGIQTIIHWDRSKFDISAQAIVQSGTISSQTGLPNIQKDPDPKVGIIVIQIGNTNPEGVIAGSGPLFGLIARVTVPDTVQPPDGWIEVQDMELTGNTQFQATYTPGFVSVTRDTTAAYTGRISSSEGSFDTLRLDTVSIALGNVRARRVREVGFSLQADTTAYEFVGIVEEGTLAGSDLWTSKQVDVRRDSIGARLVARSDLGQEGILLKIILRRTTDSAFTRALKFTDFQVGLQTCLGRLVEVEGVVTASSIIRDSTPVAVRDDRQRRGDQIRVIADLSGERVRVSTGEFKVIRAEVFDLMGQSVAIAATEPSGSSGIEIRFEQPVGAGRYVLALHGIEQSICKQFNIIK